MSCDPLDSSGALMNLTCLLKTETEIAKVYMMQAVVSLCQMLQQWVHQPDGGSAEALLWLSNLSAVVQGLVQVT